MQTVRDLLNEIDATDSTRVAALEYGVLDLEVRWNGRLKTSAGRCLYRTRRQLGGSVEITLDRLELNPKLRQEGQAAMRQTFLHELAHAIVLAAGDAKDAHGPKWKRVMRHLGAEVSRCHSYASMAATRKEKRVVARCESCGLEIRRHRALAAGKDWRHAGRCGGRLVAVR